MSKIAKEFEALGRASIEKEEAPTTDQLIPITIRLTPQLLAKLDTLAKFSEAPRQALVFILMLHGLEEATSSFLKGAPECVEEFQDYYNETLIEKVEKL